MSLINQGEAILKEIKLSLNKHTQSNRPIDQIRREQYDAKVKLKGFLEVNLLFLLSIKPF